MTAREGKGRSDWHARRDAEDLKPTNWEPARQLTWRVGGLRGRVTGMRIRP